MIDLILGDCLEKLRDIPDGSVDMVLADLPYGTTACKWDNVIPFEPLWAELHRVCKPNAAMCMFGSEPFSSKMRMSNLKRFKYDWIWKKPQGTNFFQAKTQPLKTHEFISVFSDGPASYTKSGRMNYFPQMGVGKPFSKKRSPSPNDEQFNKTGKGTLTGYVTQSTGSRFPLSVLDFPATCVLPKERGKHPTQKPVALLEYLIKTYTNEGDTVLDPTMGSGSTGVACKNLNRKFIGIEMDANYFEIAQKRITRSLHELTKDSQEALSL